MQTLMHEFDDNAPINPDSQRHYGAKLSFCKRGGVELSVCVPRNMTSDPIPPSLRLRKNLTDAERQERDAANARRAAQRARQQLRLMLKTINASYLWTFTFRDNIDDIKHVQAVYTRFRRLFVQKYPDSKFVTVPERHSENRTGWHLHTACADMLDVNWVRRCWYMALGHKVKIDYIEVNGKTKAKVVPFVLKAGEWVPAEPSEVLGNVDVRGRKRRYGAEKSDWTPERLAAYLAKYMDKTFTDAQASTRRYWPSKGCERPQVKKFWLMATNCHEAIIEAHYIVHELYGMANLSIFLSRDYMSIWVAGTGQEPPF